VRRWKLINKLFRTVYFQSDPLRSHPWYMTGGKKRPVFATRSELTGRRIAQLWPEENPSSDRIVDQLMFIPPYGKIRLFLYYTKFEIFAKLISLDDCKM
jgi:hypothetical protein